MAANPATETPAPCELRTPAPEERGALYAWLNRGLRRGSWRRLEREFPTVLGRADLSEHVLALRGGDFAGHALAHHAWLRAGAHHLRVGMIGMVYTAPEQRRGGLASRCVEAAVERVGGGGAGLCLLWSDLDEFYRRLGFVKAGREWFFWLGRHELAGGPDRSSALAVGAPTASEWPAMETLYAAHVSHAVRPPGALHRLAGSPDCAVRVARRDDRVVAYAARGRGDDFPDIVHEWAGPPDAVLACLADLIEQRDWLGLLCPPSATAMTATLSACGFRRIPNDLAWIRVVDAARLWEQLCANAPALRALAVSGSLHQIVCEAPSGEIELDGKTFLDWVLGGAAPPALDALLPEDTRHALKAALPVPLYLWGFDSV